MSIGDLIKRSPFYVFFDNFDPTHFLKLVKIPISTKIWNNSTIPKYWPIVSSLSKNSEKDCHAMIISISFRFGSRLIKWMYIDYSNHINEAPPLLLLCIKAVVVISQSNLCGVKCSGFAPLAHICSGVIQPRCSQCH